MVKKEFSIRREVGTQIAFETFDHPIIDVPVRGVNRNVTHFVTALLQKLPHLVALFKRVAFFQKWKAQQFLEVRIILIKGFPRG